MTTGLNIIGAEIVHYRNAGKPREQRAVANVNRHPLFRLMPNSLAVKTD